MDKLLKNISIKASDIIENCLSGYHRCSLEKPYHLDYASQDLCAILGYTSAEIHTLFHDNYSQMVYENDRQRYHRYIEQLASKEQTLTLQYRMVCKDGHLIHVRDTMTSRRLEDGHMYGFAIVANITDTPDYPPEHIFTISAQIVNSYGYLRCTCEKYPRVTHMNKQMMHYLEGNPEDTDWQNFLRDNLFFIIPAEEHDMFRSYMEKARFSTSPIHIKNHFFCKGGNRLLLNGWMSCVKNKYDEEELALIYMDVEEDNSSTKNIVENSYFHALKSAYNIIFEINLVQQTVECIYGRDTSAIGPIYDVRMTIESAKSFWLNNYVLEEDQDVTSDFFELITSSPLQGGWRGSPVIQAEFRCKWTDNMIHKLDSVAVQLDFSTVLVCCRDTLVNTMPSLPYEEELALEKIQDWLDCVAVQEKSSVGIVVLEKTPETSFIIHISKNICDKLGLDKTEYMTYISGERSAQQLLDAVSVSKCSLEKLLSSDSMRLIVHYLAKEGYPDTKEVTLSATSHTCGNRNFYEILIFNETSSQKLSAVSKSRIFARTFGHFDLFVDNSPVVFSNKKEKEFLALLIDRNGGTLDTEEAISYLWENEAIDDRISRRYRKLCTTLKNTLTKYGIEHIMINNHGIRSIDTSAITCDYYELLAGNPEYKEIFHNVYMSDYSWAEDTLANLWDYS